MKKRIAVSVGPAVLLAASAYAQMEVMLATPKEIQAAIDGEKDVNACIGVLTPLITAAAYNKDPAVIATLLKAGAKNWRHGNKPDTPVDHSGEDFTTQALKICSRGSDRCHVFSS